MFNQILDKVLPVKSAFAHCDIPCGIYDPHEAQVAAHTVIRMTKLLSEVKNDPDDNKADNSSDFKISRLTKVKEEHAEKVKNEVRVIWGDYFKTEQIEKYPDLHEKVFKIMKAASKAKQEISLEGSEELLKLVQDFAEIFYQSKGLEVVRVKSGFPTEGEIVSHK
ncbi:MAG: superoxide dismutase, Ni [bacterium]|nr:superoxide dismutase, Ni [bacterium]